MGQNNENTENTQERTEEPRTFTQEELNAIIQKRLGEQAAKYGDYEELKAKALKFDEIEDKAKSDLQKATERADALQRELEGMKKTESVRQIREEVSKEVGVPANLLTGDTKEACEAQAKAIIEFAKPGKYPIVNDRGEVRDTPSGTTREQFANWLEEVGGN
jgi:hypothetical protein